MLVEQSSGEWTRLDHGRFRLVANCPFEALLLDAFPKLSVQYRFVLTRMAELLVTDLPGVDRIREQRVEGSARKWSAT